MTLRVTWEKAPTYTMRFAPHDDYRPLYNLYLRLNELFTVWEFRVVGSHFAIWSVSGIKREFWDKVIAAQVSELCPGAEITWAKNDGGVTMRFPVNEATATELKYWIAMGLVRDSVLPKRMRFKSG